MSTVQGPVCHQPLRTMSWRSSRAWVWSPFAGCSLFFVEG